MKVYTPLIAWHNRERVSSVDFQPVAYPKGQPRLATAGDDKHVVVSDKFWSRKFSFLLIASAHAKA